MKEMKRRKMKSDRTRDKTRLNTGLTYRLERAQRRDRLQQISHF